MYHTKKLRRFRKLLAVLAVACLVALATAKGTATILAALVLSIVSVTVTSLLHKKIVDKEEQEITKTRKILAKMKCDGYVVQPHEVETIPEEVVEIEVDYEEA